MATQINAVMARPVGRTDGVGVDHDMRIIWKPDVDTEKEFIAKTVVIPTDEMERLIPLNTAQRADLYRDLIIQYLPYLPSPESAPPEPVFENRDNLTLVDFEEWIVVYNDWETEKASFDAQRAIEVEDAEFIANAAANWIESLPSFDEWPFSFVLQLAS